MKSKPGKYEKLYNVFWQLTLVAFYPVLFHIFAFVGKSNQYTPVLFREKAFPAALVIVFLIIFAFTAFLKIKAGKASEVNEESEKKGN